MSGAGNGNGGAGHRNGGAGETDRYAAEVGALLGWVGSRLVLAELGDPAARAQARDAAAGLAAQLVGLEPATRRAVIDPDWPPNAAALLLSATPAAVRGEMAAEMAAFGDLPALLAAGLRQEAADAATLLAPDSPASLLLQAVFALPEAAGYAAQASAGAQTLAALPASLFAVAAPSVVTRAAAILHDGLEARFGADEALAFVRGVLLQRLLHPALAEDTGAALDRLLEDAPDAAAAPVDQALSDYAAEMVEAGRQAEAAVDDGEDADGVVVQRGAALQDLEALATTFRQPTPNDKLGTLPAVRVTLLGQAILVARTRRPPLDNISWADVIDFWEQAPDNFETLLLDERCEVLDSLDYASGG